MQLEVKTHGSTAMHADCVRAASHRLDVMTPSATNRRSGSQVPPAPKSSSSPTAVRTVQLGVAFNNMPTSSQSSESSHTQRWSALHAVIVVNALHVKIAVAKERKGQVVGKLATRREEKSALQDALLLLHWQKGSGAMFVFMNAKQDCSEDKDEHAIDP
jgi:hypothetical protein